jgi:hypothetical protein
MHKCYTLLIATLLFVATGFSQGVAISAASSVPDASAMLDVQSNTKGFLVPRMTMAERNAITTPATGLLIYQSDNTPGFYYNSGTPASPTWTPLQSSAWSLSGNSGTNPATNFIGTNDNTTVLFKTNSTERMRITNNGQVIINGNTVRSSQDGLEVMGTGFPGAIAAFNYPVNGYSAGSYAGVYGLNTATGQGILGESSGTGIGVYGVAGSGGIGVSGASTTNFGTTGQTSSSSYTGVRGINTFTTGTGVLGSGNNVTAVSLYSQGSGLAGNGKYAGTYSLATDATTGYGVIALGNGITAFNNVGSGGGIGTQGEIYGITSYASTPTAAVANNKWGGYFDYLPSGNGYAFVGGRAGGTDYAILSSGVKSTMVKDEQNRNRVMFCTEAPEVLFQDYGSSKLVNGRAHVTIDPVLAKNISVTIDKPLKVFIQLEGDCNGVYVTNKTASGFDVIELQHGTSNTAFSYQLIANRANATDQSGRVISNYANVRFPVGPERMHGTANSSTSHSSQCVEIPEKCKPHSSPAN